MKEGNVIQRKSFAFAVRVIRLYRHLLERKTDVVLIRQMLRSGTSIGANVEEAIGGQSKWDFIAKMSISCKEARETDYWLRLLAETEVLSRKEAESMLLDSGELLKILASILRTTNVRNDQTGPIHNSSFIILH